MRARTNALTAALAAFAIAAAACAGAPQEEFTRADADAIRKVDADFVAAFNAKEADKILGMYTDNSVFMPPNAPTLRGTQPLKSFFGDMFARGATDLRMDPTDIAGHGPIAYQSGSYSLTTGTTRDRGKFLFVMRKMAGNWRLEYTMWSSDLPQPTS
jgi:ketosteroid isomerase-like protein